MKFLLLLTIVILHFTKPLKGQVLVGDSLALVDLYNSTNGSTWSNNTNWLSGPINSWYGIQTSGKNVVSVFLSSNNLSGIIPASIGTLSELINLYLDGNNLSGNIPSELINLQKLESLHLYYNSLSGSIPTNIGNLINLKNLHLDWNQLTGSIPSSISELSNLENLGINNNLLTGSLPPGIGDLNKLKSLVLLNNNFSGNIPEEIGNLTNLTYLDFGNNNFSGPIPASIGNLTNVEYLFLYSNNFDGTIPSEIGNIQALKFLYLYDNSISGNIPDELGNLINLEIVNFDRNFLTGSIPISFGNLTSLNQLVVSRNNLSGEVPANLTSLVNLTNLNLSQNDFIALPDMSVTASGLSFVLLEGNRFSFDDILPYISNTGLTYIPQDSIDFYLDTILYTGSESSLSVSDNSVGNIYQWTKDGNSLIDTGNISGSETSTLLINPVSVSDTGYYSCVLTNSSVTNLTLSRRLIHVKVEEAPASHQLKVYELLTPNRDGKNETFFIENVEFFPDNELIVFNQWGITVYNKKNYNNEWNGGGLPDGSYFYVFKTNSPEQVFQGGFMITH